MSTPEVDIEKVERILENSQKTCVVLDELAYLLGILPKGSQEDPQWWKERDAVCEKVRREVLRSDRIEEFGGGLRYKDPKVDDIQDVYDRHGELVTKMFSDSGLTEDDEIELESIRAEIDEYESNKVDLAPLEQRVEVLEILVDYIKALCRKAGVTEEELDAFRKDQL